MVVLIGYTHGNVYLQCVREVFDRTRITIKEQQILRSINVMFLLQKAETKYNRLRKLLVSLEMVRRLKATLHYGYVVKAAEHQYPVFIANVDGQQIS